MIITLYIYFTILNEDIGINLCISSSGVIQGGVDMAAFFNRNYLIIKNINNDYQIFNIEKNVMGVFMAFDLT